jgi:hypothetical protein
MQLRIIGRKEIAMIRANLFASKHSSTMTNINIDVKRQKIKTVKGMKKAITLLTFEYI